MDPIIPTSFIPKRPIVTEPAANVSRRSSSIWSLLIPVILAATLLAAGGVFLFERQLESQVQQMEKKISAARESFGSDFITQMKTLDNRITAIKKLIQSHVIVTPIFQALQDATLRSVQYKSFTYTLGTDEVSKRRVVRVEMNGTARNYETIALQSDAFAKSKFIKDAVFANLVVDERKGTINFKLNFNIDAAAVSYQSYIDALARPTPGQSPVDGVTL